MTLKTLVAMTAVAAALATSTQALAQAASAAPAPIAQGPSIPGVCVMSLDAAIGASTVGKYVQTRLGQISTQVQSEVNGEQTQIANDAKAIDAKRATLDQASFDKQSADIQLRANALNRKAAPNPSMDITPAVITGLNAKITQFTFDRERLDQPAPAAQTR
jgi:outer membrane protein